MHTETNALASDPTCVEKMGELILGFFVRTYDVAPLSGILPTYEVLYS